MKLQIAAVLCAALATGACAGRASSVAPVSITSTDYSSMSCERVRTELDTTRAKVNALSRRQNNAALADAAGVFLVLLPLGSVFGGGVEGELAQAKGEQAALERNLTTRCGG